MKTKNLLKSSIAFYKLAAKEKELLPGGLSTNEPDSKYNKEQIEIGTEVERFEHTDNKDTPRNNQLGKEIAKDHLEEIPDYYTYLKEMEELAEEEGKEDDDDDDDDEEGEDDEEIEEKEANAVVRFLKNAKKSK